jgi:putative FmdB family regulatory protein
MPTYEFKCEKCGKEFDFFLNRTIQEEDKVCPECQSIEVKQQFTGSSWLTGNPFSRSEGSCGSPWGFG